MNKLTSEIILYDNNNKPIETEGDLTINRSLFNLTDTITMRTSKKNTYITKDHFYINGYSFNNGNKVNIKLGYDGNIDFIFNGFISNYYSNSNEEMFIEIEDSMYLLKNMKRIKKSWKSEDNLTLKGLVDWLLEGTDLKSEVMNMNINSLTIKNYLLPSQVLKMIKEMYNLYVFFKNDILYVGHKYWDLYIEDFATKYKFSHPYNDQYNYIIEDELNYIIIDPNNYKVKSSSIYNNSKIEYEYPENIEDPNNIISLNLNGYDLESLKTITKEKWNNLNKGGMNGNFTTFGIPPVNVGDIIKLKYDTSYIKDQEEIIEDYYYVDENEITFGIDGYKQKIILGNKIT